MYEYYRPFIMSHFNVFVNHLCAGLLSSGLFAFSHPPHSLALPLPIVRSTCGPSRIKSGPLGEADSISVERAEFGNPALL